MQAKPVPNRAVPTPGPLVVLGGADGRGWDVETREEEGQPAQLVGRFNSRGDAKLFAEAQALKAALTEIHKLWCCPAPKRLKDWEARCDVMADYARQAIARATRP